MIGHLLITAVMAAGPDPAACDGIADDQLTPCERSLLDAGAALEGVIREEREQAAGRENVLRREREGCEEKLRTATSTDARPALIPPVVEVAVPAVRVEGASPLWVIVSGAGTFAAGLLAGWLLTR